MGLFLSFFPFNFERPLSLRGPQRSCMFAVLALELIGHPDECTVNDDTVIAGQVHDSSFDDESAEFDQMPRTLAALDLPGAHIMSRPRRLMPLVFGPAAPESRQRRG